MDKIAAIAAGGAIGALCRYGLSGLVHRVFGEGFPWGTAVVNIVGCFAIGMLFVLAQERGALNSGARLFWLVGLCGSFTTFSAFGLELVELLRLGQTWAALAYMGLNVVVGVAAVVVGAALGRVVWGYHL